MNISIYNIRFCSENALVRKNKTKGNHVEIKKTTFYLSIDL